MKAYKGARRLIWVEVISIYSSEHGDFVTIKPADLDPPVGVMVLTDKQLEKIREDE